MAEWILDDRNAESLLEISGVGRKTIDYMKLLSGQQAIPIDRHMFQFLEIAGGKLIIIQRKQRSVQVKKNSLNTHPTSFLVSTSIFQTYNTTKANDFQ